MQVQSVLGALALLDTTLIARDAEDRHLADAQAAIGAALLRTPQSTLVFTGRAQSIQSLKARLKSAGTPPAQLTRAYWAVGKTGLE